MGNFFRRNIFLTLFTGLLLFVFELGIAQQAQIDSLENALEEKKTPLEKSEVLIELARMNVGVNYDKAYEYGVRGTKEAEKTDSLELQWYSYYTLGRVCAVGAIHLDTALIFMDKALETAEAIQDTQRTLLAHMLAAAVLDYTDQTEEALVHYHEAIPLAEGSGNMEYISSIYNNLGLLYHYSEDTLNARKYYKQAIDIFRETKDTLAWARASANYTSVIQDPDEAIRINKFALSLLEEIDNNPQLKFICTEKIGNIYLQKKDAPETALNWFLRALKYAEEGKVEPSIASAQFSIGTVKLYQNKLGEALEYLGKSYDYYSQTPQDDNIQRVARDYSEALARTGNYSRAYELLNQSYQIKDSIYTKNLATSISEFNSKYEKEQTEAKLAAEKLNTAREKNRKNQILIGALILLLIAGFVFQYFWNRQRQRKKEADLELEKERLERSKLTELDTLKTRFFANISHELRTPLTLIMAPLEKALSDKPINPKLEQELELAHSNSNKLLTLVNEILDLSKLESGKLELDMQATPLQSFLERVLFSFQSLADIRKIELHLEYDCPAGLNIETDREKLEKILNNLLSNALKFTPSEGQVTLRAESTEEQGLILSVTDTGQGIASEDLPRIFDRFYQTGNQGGTGIGLALSKELAKLFGGSLDVASEPGNGSVFTLGIPLLVSKSDIKDLAESTPKYPEEEQTKYKTQLHTESKPRILIVEDQPEMQRFLRESLEEDYICEVANEGGEALRLLQTKQFDLTSSDVMMPGMDGFTLREKINQIPRLRNMPFILLTARALDEDKMHGLRLGVDDYITKPFSLPELKARVENLLRNKFEREKAWEESEIKPDSEAGNKESADRELIREAEQQVLENLDRSDYKIGDLATEIGYGERQLRRIIRNLTGLSPVEFILEIRLQKARQLLEKRKLSTVAEIQFEVGIESASYFSKKFTERFGKNPSAYVSNTK